MEKKSGWFILIIFIALIVFSCKHEIPVVPVTGGNTGVCFEDAVLPLFQSNCSKSGCHDADTRAGGYQLDNHTNIIARGIIASNGADSKMYKVLIDSNSAAVMPPSYNNALTDSQKNLIKTWINEGAKNTTNCSSCDSSKFTFAANIQPILQTHCLGCHGGVAIDGGFIPLDNYDGVKQLVKKLYPSVSHAENADPMPKIGNKLNDCKIATIRKWIDAGAPNN